MALGDGQFQFLDMTQKSIVQTIPINRQDSTRTQSRETMPIYGVFRNQLPLKFK